MTRFERFLGIDYSGAGTPTSTQKGIQVYSAGPEGAPSRERNPRRKDGRWSRRDLANWLIEALDGPEPALVGLDHAFSFPEEILVQHGIRTWDHFLDWFTRTWRTDERSVRAAIEAKGLPTEDHLLRLGDRWTPSAKSLFARIGPGVFHSTFGGIPWLAKMRGALGDRAHFWPFDGWTPAGGRSVVVEVYPAVFKRRYETRSDLTPDMKDAYSVARWMQDMSARGALASYFSPPLTDDERRQATVEGWILGVT